jgi:hypothetical protein
MICPAMQMTCAALVLCGQAHEARDRRARAAACYKKALQIDPFCAEVCAPIGPSVLSLHKEELQKRPICAEANAP